MSGRLPLSAHVGAGYDWFTAVIAGEDGLGMLNWQAQYAERVRWVTSSALRDMLRLTQKADIIAFSGGLPAPELFPIERFRHAADLVLSAHGQQALQYSPTEGYSPLRRLVASYLNVYGVSVDECNVLITTGSQQATELIGRLLLNLRDPVLVESPTYVGALQAFDVYNPDYLIVPADENGLVIDDLDPLLEREPKFLYVLPNYQNPSGTTLPHFRREQLIRRVHKADLVIVEDDPCSLLRYEGEDIPPLIVLDALRNGSGGPVYDGNVLYHSTYSKLLAPGLRIGWIIGPAEVIQQLARLKQGVDLHTSTFAQMLAFEVARDGFLEEHVKQLREIYHHRRDVMLAALEAQFPPEVTWTRPTGGMFIFVSLPEGIDAKDVLMESLKQMVAFVPGESFFPRGGGENSLRLTFSSVKPDRIEEGIKRLGAILKNYCNRV